jgi:hypothetical protein
MLLSYYAGNKRRGCEQAAHYSRGVKQFFAWHENRALEGKF